MPYPYRLDGLVAKVEPTGFYGVDASPASTDGIRVLQRLAGTFRPSYGWQNLLTDAATGTIFPPTAAQPHGYYADFDVFCAVRGYGAAYTAAHLPEPDPLIQASGWDIAVDTTGGAEKVTYTLLADPGDHLSATCYCYVHGLLFVMLGCRGTLTWIARVGEVGVMRFQMRGLIDSVAASAGYLTITYSTEEPVASVAMGLAINPGASYSPDWTTAEFVQGAQVQRLDSGNATDGIAEFNWLQVDPTFTFAARVPSDGAGAFDTGSWDPFADQASRVDTTIAWTHGSTQYLRAKLAIAHSYLTLPALTEQSQAAALDCSLTVTDPALTIIFD
jgi:hypothetical protein